MSVLLEIAIKTTVLFALALAALPFLRARSAALRHAVLALTFICATALPILTSLPPAWRLPIPSAWLALEDSTPVTISSEPRRFSDVDASAGAAEAAPTRTRVSALSFVIGLWLAGALAALIRVLAGMWHLRHLARHSSPLQSGASREVLDRIAQRFGIQRPIALLQSSHPTMLVTWGVVRPHILLPASASNWSTDRIEVVLRHEVAHIARGDWLILIAASAVRAMHWFNPIVWIGHLRLRQESEQACDDLVLESGISPADYASHLLAVARETIRRRHVWSAAAAIAHPSTLEGRVRAMLNAHLNRRPTTAIARCTAALVAMAATFAIAGAGVSTLAAPAVSLPPSPAPRVEMPSPAPAQQAGPGTINGVLYDQLGGLLPGVSVTLVQQPDGARYDTTSDRNGAFGFTLLPPGEYQLTTSLPGFATVTNRVKIDRGTALDRSITLPLGTLQESVSVVGPSDPRVTSAGPRPAVHTRTTPEQRTFFSGGIGGQIRMPTKIVHVSPVYPSTLQNASGIVLLQARVGIDGFLSDIRDVTGSRSTPTHEAFVASAIDAVRQWEFRPTLLNNVPVETNIQINIDYSTR